MTWHGMTAHHITNMEPRNQSHYFTHLAANYLTSCHITSQHITTTDTPRKHNQILDTTQRPPPDGMVQHKNFGLGIALVSFLAYKVFSAWNFRPGSPGNSWYLDRYTVNVVWYCMNNKSRPPPIGWWLKVKTTIGHGQTQAGARTATAGFCWLFLRKQKPTTQSSHWATSCGGGVVAVANLTYCYASFARCQDQIPNLRFGKRQPSAHTTID